MIWYLGSLGNRVACYVISLPRMSNTGGECRPDDSSGFRHVRLSDDHSMDSRPTL